MAKAIEESQKLVFISESICGSCGGKATVKEWKRESQVQQEPSAEQLRCPHCNSPARKIDWCHEYRLPHVCPTDHIDHQRPDLFCKQCGGLLININESEDEDAEEMLVCANVNAHNRAGDDTRELREALAGLLACTERRGDAAKLLAVGKAERVLAQGEPRVVRD